MEGACVIVKWTPFNNNYYILILVLIESEGKEGVKEDK